jgi:hypothetical protein
VPKGVGDDTSNRGDGVGEAAAVEDAYVLGMSAIPRPVSAHSPCQGGPLVLVQAGEPQLGGGRFDLGFEWWCPGRPPLPRIWLDRFIGLGAHGVPFLSAASTADQLIELVGRQRADERIDRQSDRFGRRGRGADGRAPGQFGG